MGVAPAVVAAQMVAALTVRTPARPLARAPSAARMVAARVAVPAPQVSDRVQVLNGLPLPAESQPGVPALTGLAGTVKEVASAAGIDDGTLRWANDLRERQEAAPGQVLVLPPARGSLMWHPAGETPEHFAGRTGVSLPLLAEYNLHPEAADRRYLQVPLGTPGASLASSEVVVAAPGVPAVPASQRSHGGNHFPFGQCTWFVATKRDVWWNGDAGQWLRAARGQRPEGRVPVVGAIAVQVSGPDVGPVGHVTYVTAINPDGSFQVAEMNHVAAGVVDQRTLRVAQDDVAGFIY